MKKNAKEKNGINILKANLVGGNLKPRGQSINKSKYNWNETCWICEKTGHFARDFWYLTDRIDHEAGLSSGYGYCRGRGRGRVYRGVYRVSGSFRGRDRGYHHHQGSGLQHQMQAYSQELVPQENYFVGGNTPQQGTFVQEGRILTGQAARIKDRPPPLYPGNLSASKHTQGHFGFMVQVIFRSTVATSDEKNSNDTLMDSGGSHHFFIAIVPSSNTKRSRLLMSKQLQIFRSLMEKERFSFSSVASSIWKRSELQIFMLIFLQLVY